MESVRPSRLKWNTKPCDLGLWIHSHWKGESWLKSLCKRWGTNEVMLRRFVACRAMLTAPVLYRIYLDTKIPMEVMIEQWASARLEGKHLRSATKLARKDRTMRIYVAAPFGDRDKAKAVADLLEERGATITEDWWHEKKDNSIDVDDVKFGRERAQADVNGVLTADMLVALVPKEGGCGMWWECGMALASGIPVVRIPLEGLEVPHRTIFDYITPTASLTKVLEIVEKRCKGAANGPAKTVAK